MIHHFKKSRSLWLAAGVGLAMATLAWAKPDYAVVVSAKTQADPDWAKVVAALKSSHAAQVLVYREQVDEVLPLLREQFPRYVCFVAAPQDAGRELVGRVHRLTRQMDDDPYADCRWGILTGFDAASALRIAQDRKPLTVHKVASGTEIALEMCEEGQWYDELIKNKHVIKTKGGEAKAEQGPDDTTEALVKCLTEYRADLFVTSGHATERDWMIGFRYQNGFFRCENGVLYGLDTRKQKFPIHSANPKVYMPIGNCLMGHVDGTNAMALAWMNSAGVRQMLGYTVPSWYGYAGWGCLDYFIEQPGRYTFAEAYLANQHALIHRLKTCFPGAEAVAADANGVPKTPVAPAPEAKAAGLGAMDLRGLLYDRDVLAFYGDPAWSARMAAGTCAWEQSLTEKKGTWTFTITPKRGELTFAPINKNGSQRGGRPLIAFLPQRVMEAKVLAGAELNPVITDDFILVPNPKACDPAKPYQVVFQAKTR